MVVVGAIRTRALRRAIEVSAKLVRVREDTALFLGTLEADYFPAALIADHEPETQRVAGESVRSPFATAAEDAEREVHDLKQRMELMAAMISSLDTTVSALHDAVPARVLFPMVKHYSEAARFERRTAAQTERRLRQEEARLNALRTVRALNQESLEAFLVGKESGRKESGRKESGQ